MSGHRGDASTLNNISSFIYWPAMFKWVTMLIHDCLDYQKKNKSKRQDFNEVPLQQLGELETTPFHTIHIDHKGLFWPFSNGMHYCLVVVDSFSRYVQVYAVKSANSVETIKQMEKFITSFGILQHIVHDNGTSIMSSDFVNWTFELGITLRPRMACSPCTNGKVEIQNKHLTNYLRHFLNTTGNNWAKFVDKFAFAHNTAVSYSTGYTPYEVIFGIKPQIPISFRLGLLRDNKKNCISQYCQDLPSHTHCKNSCINEKVDNLLQNRLSNTVLQCETDFKNMYCNTYTCCRQVTNKAHEYRNRFKLGRPISIGSKVLLENHSKSLLISKTLKSLRCGPYTVTKHMTNTT